MNNDDKKKNEKKKQKQSMKVQVWKKKSTIAYENELEMLHKELVKLQNWVKESGAKIVVLFEGRDASGKGGTIKRVTEHLNARGARVVALEKPSDTERTQWYFQRYVQHLPSAGEIVLFDRSWYNRAGVEPVMGYCTERQHQEFLKEVPGFEHMLIKSGIILVKFYFSVSKEEQARRFEDRKANILKRHKLSPVDMEAQKLWEKYTFAEYEMFTATHSAHAPWTVIHSDDKKRARINAIKYFLSQVGDYPEKTSVKNLAYDPEIVVHGSDEYIKMKDRMTMIEGSNDLFWNVFKPMSIIFYTHRLFVLYLIVK